MKSLSCQTLSCTLLDTKTVILLGNFVIWFSNFVNLSTTFFIQRFLLFSYVFYSWSLRYLHLWHKSLDHLIEIMNSELIIIANWFKANRLSLNLEKTNFIVFSSLRKKLSTIKPLYINEIPIIQTRSSKFLGVIVDEHLTWRDHVLAV